MKKSIAARLLAGSSVAALSVALAAGAAQAQGMEVDGTTHSGDLVNEGTTEWIVIRNDGVVEGDVINEGEVEPGHDHGFGIGVTTDATVEGSVVNEAGAEINVDVTPTNDPDQTGIFGITVGGATRTNPPSRKTSRITATSM